MFYIYKRGTQAGRLARDLGLSVTFMRDGRRIMRARSLSPSVAWGTCAGFAMPETCLNRNARTALSKLETWDAIRRAGLVESVPLYGVKLSDFDGIYSGPMLARTDKGMRGQGITLPSTDEAARIAEAE